MAKVKILHFLLILLLLPSLLVGCGTPARSQEVPQTPAPEAPVAKKQAQKQNDKIKQLEEQSKKLENDNKSLKKQVQTLSQDIQKLSNSHNQWIFVSLIALLAAMGAIGALLYPLFRKTQAMKLPQLPEKSQFREENSAFVQGNQELSEAIYYQINDAVNKLHGQIYHSLSQELSNQIRTQFITIEARLQALERDLIPNYQGNSPYKNIAPTHGELANQPIQTPGIKSRSIPTNQYSNWLNVGWVATYNKNPDSFSTEATEVSETEQSIEARRLGTSQPAIFEKARRGKGNYWILIQSGFSYLVPKANIKINEYNYETVETLFECQGYQSGYSSDFTLVKPAIVSPILSGEKWQLVELGVLQF